MADDKPSIILRPAWWPRDTFLFLQAILAGLLLRLILYSYTSVESAERESRSLFLIKFTALVLVLVCLALQALQ